MLRSVFIALWLQNYLQNSGVRSQVTPPNFCNAGMCYSLHLDRRSFPHAKKLCEDKRGILSTMESPGEAENIRRLLENNVPAKAQLYHLWIGLHRKVKQCYYPDKPLRGFYWVNGNDHSTYSPWIGEPERTCTHERCVQLQAVLPNQLQWKTSACNKENDGFICKYQMCEHLNFEFGEVVYQKPQQSGSEFWPAVPAGSVAIIGCPNGKSVVLKCDRENGKIKWSSSRSQASMCNSCWNKTNESSCQNRCFQIAGDYFCYCNKDFSMDPLQRKCVPNGNVESGFNESSRNGFIGTASVAANISAFPASTLATEPPTRPFPQTAENVTVTFPPTFRDAEQGKQEAHSNAPFLIYQVIIGVLVLVLLIMIVVIIIRERRRGGTHKAAPSEDGLALKSTDSVPQVNAKDSVETVNVTNENHYVETTSASENEVNVPKENGEISR
ncbi:C-type lectin domain family 14 member A [Chiloscyllium plagiosum]|uniref:C-type lectin domain family 14 member A n=1 Tax=Chiloscyllium plagiosum TaxID=36176 RepID=UPI001CB83DE4|nr:C-type lectin domain family 14 member A [Chiloscyllium plagiosum]